MLAVLESQKGSKIDSIRARYYGVDDALATKYMGRLTDGSGKRGGRGGGKLEPPADEATFVEAAKCVWGADAGGVCAPAPPATGAQSSSSAAG